MPPFSEFEAEFNVKPHVTFKGQAKHVYDHWKRRRILRKGATLIPSLKMDEGLRDDTDPYVCFRRRETKPVRKTRRTDQQSLEKLRKLRAELETARSLLEMVTRREKLRKESLLMEHSIFNQRCMLREMQQLLGIKDEYDLFPVKKKRKSEVYSGYVYLYKLCSRGPLHINSYLHEPLLLKTALESKYPSISSNAILMTQIRNPLHKLPLTLKLLADGNETLALKMSPMYVLSLLFASYLCSCN